MTDPLVGTLIDDRYLVVSRIARGGMATVYIAHDQRLDRDVALKVMHPHLADGALGADFVARFRREARAAARLSHPGLVAVHDQGIAGEVSYLTMEYVPGSNLRTRMSSPPPLSVGEVLVVIESILDALGAVHRENLVHRDLKPENVLLSQDGRIKVTDFGLARAITEVTAASTGTMMGTVAYLSPELIATGQGDARADVYAAGIMLHELLTGAPPFSGTTPIQIALQHLHADMPPVSGQVPALPVEIDELVAALTARDTSDRPGDATAALGEVRRVHALLDETTLSLTVPSPLDVIRPPLRSSIGESTELDRESVTAAEHPATTTGAALDPDTTHTLALRLHSTTSLQRGPITPETGTALAPVRATPPPAGLHATVGIRPSTTRLRRRLVATAIVLIVLAAGGTGGYLWYQKVGPGAYTTVPTGTVATASTVAKQKLSEAGLSVLTHEAYSDTVPTGEVIDAAPQPGERIRESGTVTLTVSKGVEHFTVPEKLIGQDKSDAGTLIEEAGFSLGKATTEYYDDVAKGKVTAVSVPEGSSQPHDTVVTLTVSGGPAPVTVPDVTGVTEDEAKASLESVGLRMDRSESRYDDTVPKGSVISQSPKARSKGHRKDTIEVVVSRGPTLVTVPSVVRMSEADATEALKDAGFEVSVNRYLNGILDTVRFQDVDGGTKAPRGSTVTITVW